MPLNPKHPLCLTLRQGSLWCSRPIRLSPQPRLLRPRLRLPRRGHCPPLLPHQLRLRQQNPIQALVWLLSTCRWGRLETLPTLAHLQTDSASRPHPSIQRSASTSTPINFTGFASVHLPVVKLRLRPQSRCGLQLAFPLQSHFPERARARAYTTSLPNPVTFDTSLATSRTDMLSSRASTQGSTAEKSVSSSTGRATRAIG